MVTEEQLSVAVGAVQNTTGLFETIFEGHPLILGAVLSTRLTLNVQVVELLEPSVHVTVTLVVPTPLITVPATGDCVLVTPLQLSEATTIEV